MKKIFTHLQLGLLAIVVLMASSCKQEKLGDVLADETYSPVSLSLDSKIEVGTGSNVTLTGADLTIPVTLNFSAPTTRAFTATLATNVDTVAQLITAGTLPAGTVAFTAGTAGVVPTINVPIGVTKVSFNVVVNRSFMEINYGKNLAAVIKVSNPAKGNTIAPGKGAMIVVVKTAEVMAANLIHEISFATPTNKLAIPTTGYYEVGSESITINVPLKLQGTAGAEFNVTATLAPDSVTKYINDGTLNNSVLYANNKISLASPTVKFLAGSNTAVLSFTTKINTLLAVQPGQAQPSTKLPTIAFTLSNPTQFQLAKTNNTVYVVIDPNFFRPYYGTPFVIKGDIGVESPTIFAAYYDFGGEGVAYHDNNTKDGDGAWRAPDQVDVTGNSTPRTTVGWTANDEWLTYSVFIEKSGVYDMSLLLGSSNTNGRATVFLDNVLITPEQIKGINTGSDYNNQKPVTSTVTLIAGYHILKAYWNVGQFDFNGFIFKRKS